MLECQGCRRTYGCVETTPPWSLLEFQLSRAMYNVCFAAFSYLEASVMNVCTDQLFPMQALPLYIHSMLNSEHYVNSGNANIFCLKGERQRTKPNVSTDSSVPSFNILLHRGDQKIRNKKYFNEL